jgi:hypothetical protein
MMHINFRFHFTTTRQYIDYGFNLAGTMHTATTWRDHIYSGIQQGSHLLNKGIVLLEFRISENI